MEVVGTGVICPQSFVYLHHQMQSVLDGVPAYVLKIDEAVFLIDEPPNVCNEICTPGAPGSAWIVPSGQLKRWIAYADKLTERGFVRAVFTPSNAALAYRFADFHALMRESSDYPVPV